MNIALGNTKNSSLPTGLIHLAKESPSLAGRGPVLRGVTTRSQKAKTNYTSVRTKGKRKGKRKGKKGKKGKKRGKRSKGKGKKGKRKGKKGKKGKGKGKHKKNKLLFRKGRAVYYNSLGKKKSLTFAQVTKKVPRQTLLKLLGHR